MKEKKKSHQIQFKPSVHAKGKKLAQNLGISFQELLERLILLGEELCENKKVSK
jgi:hypothetical protein